MSFVMMSAVHGPIRVWPSLSLRKASGEGFAKLLQIRLVYCRHGSCERIERNHEGRGGCIA